MAMMTGTTGISARRGQAIARGALVLLAMVLLPLVATLQTPRPGAAQSTGQDSLWAGHGSRLAACASPSSAASLAGCFSAPTNLGNSAGTIWKMATDGVNVYFVTLSDGGYSCPIADLGANCIHIMAGPWPRETENTVNALAAHDGQIWIGQDDGKIYRCAANIPYKSQDNMPAGCTLLDDAGQRPVMSLLLANGRLYAGLDSYGSQQKKQGILWSCDPQAVNACATLDTYGKTYASSLAAGGGYLWAGLANGIIWRCDPGAANACADWEQGGNGAQSLSYDGQGTLYAAIAGKNGVIWSCPTAAANQCSNLFSSVNGVSVAAGDGSVFSSANGLFLGSSPFTATSSNLINSTLLHVPAGGVTGFGAADVTVSAGKLGRKFDRRCDHGGKPRNGKAIVTVTGSNDVAKTMKVGKCDLVKGGAIRITFDLLDPGVYEVTATAGKHSGQASFTIEGNRTRSVKVKLS